MRIDQLTPNTKVTLEVGPCGQTEPAVFLGVTGTGDDRTAKFSQDGQSGPFEWEAYRYKGRWAYGTGADPLRLVEVHDWRFTTQTVKEKGQYHSEIMAYEASRTVLESTQSRSELDGTTSIVIVGMTPEKAREKAAALVAAADAAEGK